jgi:hypothetical protein
MAQTDDGLYGLDMVSSTFGVGFAAGQTSGRSVSLREDGGWVVNTQTADPQLLECPVRSRVEWVSAGGVETGTLSICVSNPFEQTIMVNLRQPLPSGLQVAWADGGAIGQDAIHWEMELIPGESRILETIFQPSEQIESVDIPPAAYTIYDRINDAWLDFPGDAAELTPGTASLDFPVWLPDGALQMTLRGQAGRTYTIQVSTDFVAWTALTTFTATDAIVEVTDPDASIHGRRFYRAVVW